MSPRPTPGRDVRFDRTIGTAGSGASLLTRFLSLSKIRLTRAGDCRCMQEGVAPAPRTNHEEIPTAAPVVDVVVPVYNEARALEPAVRRLHRYLTSDFPFSWRISNFSPGRRTLRSTRGCLSQPFCFSFRK